jgi:hypothetical protein
MPLIKTMSGIDIFGFNNIRSSRRATIALLMILLLATLHSQPVMAEEVTTFSDGQPRVEVMASSQTPSIMPSFSLPNNAIVESARMMIEGKREETVTSYHHTTNQDFSAGAHEDTIAMDGDIVLATSIQLKELLGIVWSPEGDMAYLYGFYGYLVRYNGTGFKEIVTGVNYDFRDAEWIGEEAKILSYHKVGDTTHAYVHAVDREGNFRLDASAAIPYTYISYILSIGLRSDGTGIAVGAVQTRSNGVWHDLVYKYTPGHLDLIFEGDNDGNMYDFEWLDDEKALIVGRNYDGLVRTMEFTWSTGKVRYIKKGDKGGSPHMAVHPMKEYALLGGKIDNRWGCDGEIYRYDIDDEKLTKLKTSKCSITDVAWDPAGKKALLVGNTCMMTYSHQNETLTELPHPADIELRGIGYNHAGGNDPQSPAFALVVGRKASGVSGYLASYPPFTEFSIGVLEGNYASQALEVPQKGYSATLSWEETSSPDQEVLGYIRTEGNPVWMNVESGKEYSGLTGKLSYKMALKTGTYGTSPAVHDVHLGITSSHFPENVTVSIGGQSPPIFEILEKLDSAKQVTDFGADLENYLEAHRWEAEQITIPLLVKAEYTGKVALFNLSVRFRLEINRPPVLVPDPPNDVTVMQGETQNFSVEASDPENDPLTVYWKLDGEQMEDGSWKISLDTGEIGVGKCNVSVWVSDGIWTVSYQWEMTVLEPPPPPEPPKPPVTSLETACFSLLAIIMMVFVLVVATYIIRLRYKRMH